MQDIILDRYQVIEVIGRGGYGTVLHAYDTRLKREVAIKTINLPQEINTTQIRESESNPSSDLAIPGLDEARAAGKLSNANIVTIYDCVVENGVAYVIEEYVEGITLTQLAKALDRSITLDMITEIFRGLSNAIVAAHKKNILHLDIKPDNVLIGRGGEVKVADFGLATLMDINGEGVASAGTIGYMPPEQMRSQALDVRTDEWSLAMIIYELLTGSNPTLGLKDITSALTALESAEMIVPSVCWADMSEEVDDALFRAMSLEREERYSSVKDFADQLKGHLGSARTGKRELATFVNGDDKSLVETLTSGLSKEIDDYKENNIPFIDRVGSRGLKIISRVVALVSGCCISGLALANIHLDTTMQYGLFSQYFPICVGVLLAVGVISAIWPKISPIILIIFLVAMFGFNLSWGCALTLLICGALWWWFLGRRDERSTSLVMLTPLLGAISLTPVIPALSGALLDIREATLTTVMACVLAILFASMGSANLFAFDAAAHALLPLNPQVAGEEIGKRFLEMLTSYTTWRIFASWILATFVYSLFCRRGTRVFDILGSIISGTILILGAWGLEPMSVASASVGALFCVLAAILSLTDRVRLEPGSW